uniref:Uncharacterized protein n=1 Tax=viral metagenome TaxID=1070528 RepID=A0A6H1ZV31_9ZZZZ
MRLFFTKIKWAGAEHILITDDIQCRKPLLILDIHNIKELIKEAIKRAKHYREKWVETGDYYFRGMLDAELLAHNITEEDLK